MANLTCRHDTLLSYSELCLGDSPPDDCYPDQKGAVVITFHVIQFMILGGGIVGNLATLTAIPYAMHSQR